MNTLSANGSSERKGAALLPLRYYFWKPSHSNDPIPVNFGDDLFCKIAGQLAGGEISTCAPNYPGRKLFIGGSTLSYARNGDHVWGAGIRNGQFEPTVRYLNVHAVRGPNTAAILRERGIRVPFLYGDPAILWPELFPELGERRPRWDCGIVPHFREFIHSQDSTYPPNVKVISPTQDPLVVLDEIRQCRRVVASSLHGIICAEAIGIPAEPYQLDGPDAEPDFKYADYYAASDREWQPHSSLAAAMAGQFNPPPDYSAERAFLRQTFPIVLKSRLANGAEEETNQTIAPTLQANKPGLGVWGESAEVLLESARSEWAAGRGVLANLLCEEAVDKNPDDSGAQALLAEIRRCLGSGGHAAKAAPAGNRVAKRVPAPETRQPVASLDAASPAEAIKPAAPAGGRGIDGAGQSTPTAGASVAVVSEPLGMICVRPFYFFEISHLNKVHLCCPAWGKAPIGDLHHETLDEVWNNAAAQNIRRLLYERKWQTICNTLCPHVSKYRATGEILNQEQIQNHRDLNPQLVQDILERRTALSCPPTFINFSNASQCNLDCIMCFRHNYNNDLALAERTIEQVQPWLRTAKGLLMCGMGDPLARPDTRRMLLGEKLGGDGLKIHLQTNGLLLPRYFDRIKHQPIGSVYMSVDGATKETYERIRRGGHWEDVLKTFDLLRNHLEVFNYILIDMTVMRSNYREIPQYLDWVESYGFNACFQRIRGHCDKENIFEDRDAACLEELREILNREYWRKRKVNITWGDLLEFVDTQAGGPKVNSQPAQTT